MCSLFKGFDKKNNYNTVTWVTSCRKPALLNNHIIHVRKTEETNPRVLNSINYYCYIFNNLLLLSLISTFTCIFSKVIYKLVWGIRHANIHKVHNVWPLYPTACFLNLMFNLFNSIFYTLHFPPQMIITLIMCYSFCNFRWFWSQKALVELSFVCFKSVPLLILQDNL